MTIRKILIDMDDVLCDCTGDALRHMGLHGWVRESYPIETRDIYEVYRLATGVQYSPAQFWEHFKREWWANIQPTPWCHDLINLCTEYVSTDRIALLTSPTKCGDCLAGKLDWIETNMPKWMHRQYLMSPRKAFCASEGVVLIDDCTENLEAFEQDDGFGIAMPQMWNDARPFIGKELEYLKNKLDNFQRWGSI